MTKRNRILFISCCFLVILIIFLKADMPLKVNDEGYFSYDEEIFKESSKVLEDTNLDEYVKYNYIDKEINGLLEKIYILEIKLNKYIDVVPVLGQDSIFGFELLSSIDTRTKAYASINSGFFYEYGQPGGMVTINGKTVSRGTGVYPVLVISEEKAWLKEIKTQMHLIYEGQKMNVNKINEYQVNSGDVIAYTPEYGSDNRLNLKNLTIVIKNNKIEKVIKTDNMTMIPEDGILVSFIGEDRKNPFKEGNSIEFKILPDLGEKANAFECGTWIIKDGKIVVPESNNWIGVLSNHDPRTAVGIKKDGTLVFIVADGRQPGFSYGFTGKELADFLYEYGIVDAAMLDGGASSEMIYKGNILNRPSAGRERLVGGGFVIKKN